MDYEFLRVPTPRDERKSSSRPGRFCPDHPVSRAGPCATNQAWHAPPLLLVAGVHLDDQAPTEGVATAPHEDTSEILGVPTELVIEVAGGLIVAAVLAVVARLGQRVARHYRALRSKRRADQDVDLEQGTGTDDDPAAEIRSGR